MAAASLPVVTLRGSSSFAISSRASALGRTFHCRGVSRFSVGVVSDVAVEHQVLVEVAQGRELARHRTSINMVGKEMVEEVAHVLPPRAAERPLLQEAGELGDVARVGRDGERRQALLNLQVIDERGEFLRDGLAGGHAASMRVIGRGEG